MDNLKQIIEQEVNHIIPLHFEKTMSEKVMKQIEKPQRSILPSFFIDKENIKLMLLVAVCTLVVYLFGFNDSFKIKISISNDLISNTLPKVSCATLVVLFLLHDYFERKKRLLI